MWTSQLQQQQQSTSESYIPCMGVHFKNVHYNSIPLNFPRKTDKKLIDTKESNAYS